MSRGTLILRGTGIFAGVLVALAAFIFLGIPFALSLAVGLLVVAPFVFAAWLIDVLQNRRP